VFGWTEAESRSNNSNIYCSQERYEEWKLDNGFLYAISILGNEKYFYATVVLFMEIWGLKSDPVLAEVANLHRFLMGSGNDGLMIDAGLSTSSIMPPLD
jgi:hypothetical protein